MEDEYFNPGGDSAQDFERLLGQRVVVYYTDPRGTSRKIVGKLVEVDGDLLWFENTNRRTGENWRELERWTATSCGSRTRTDGRERTGENWRGALNCAHNDVTMISTVDGWSDEFKETHTIKS